VARPSKDIAVSICCTLTCCVETKFEWLEISFDCRGQPLGRRQFWRRRLMEARSARAWSWAGSAWAIWPNSFRRRNFTREMTGGWPVLERTSWLATWAMNRMCTGRRHQDIVWTLQSYSMCRLCKYWQYIYTIQTELGWQWDKLAPDFTIQCLHARADQLDSSADIHITLITWFITWSEVYKRVCKYWQYIYTTQSVGDMSIPFPLDGQGLGPLTWHHEVIQWLACWSCSNWFRVPVGKILHAGSPRRGW